MTDHSLNRLRAANPFADGTTVDAGALFDAQLRNCATAIGRQRHAANDQQFVIALCR